MGIKEIFISFLGVLLLISIVYAIENKLYVNQNMMNNALYNVSWMNSTNINVTQICFQGICRSIWFTYNSSYEYWLNYTLMNTFNSSYDAKPSNTYNISYNAQLGHNTTSEMISALNITSYYQFQSKNSSQVYNSSYESTYNSSYQGYKTEFNTSYLNITGCANGQIWKVSGNSWICTADASGTGGGEDVYVNESGDSMTGDLNMGSNKITVGNLTLNATTSGGINISIPVTSGFPDPSYTFDGPSIVWEGGEEKFGKWRNYFNGYEQSWALSYNVPWNYTNNSWGPRDSGSALANDCVFTRFNLAEGDSGVNTFEIVFAGNKGAGAGSYCDWGTAASYYFFDGRSLTNQTLARPTVLRMYGGSGQDVVLYLTPDAWANEVALVADGVDDIFHLSEVKYNVLNDFVYSYFIVMNISTGNVGINNTNPSSAFEISRAAINGISLNVSGDLFVNDSTGFVGIGTANPTYKFQVEDGNMRVSGHTDSDAYFYAAQGFFANTPYSADYLLGLNGNAYIDGHLNVTHNITVGEYIFNSTGDIEWIRPENVWDIDVEDIESDLNTFVDIAGDIMTGNLTINQNLSVDGTTLWIDSNNNWVGIGTSNPTYPLYVVGSMRLDTGHFDLDQYLYAGDGIYTATGYSTSYKLGVGGNAWINGEANITGISGDGTGKVVCIKSDGNMGTCSSVVGVDGTCTCG